MDGRGRTTSETTAPVDAPEPETALPSFPPGRPILTCRATVVTMDPGRGVLPETDVLTRGTSIEAVGPHLPAPEVAGVLDADGALPLPGFVDTHRHMWQSAFRGVGADWTISN